MSANEEPNRTLDDSAALRKWIDPIADRFDAAWQAALQGGTQPNIEDFLGYHSEPDRSALRRELELIDREYRDGLADASGALPSGRVFRIRAARYTRRAVETSLLSPRWSGPG